jgi:hypothetical protein
MGDESANGKGQHPQQEIFDANTDRIQSSVDICGNVRCEQEVQSHNKKNLYSAMAKVP